jgi:hypothetical protein
MLKSVGLFVLNPFKYEQRVQCIFALERHFKPKYRKNTVRNLKQITSTGVNYLYILMVSFYVSWHSVLQVLKLQ